MANNFKVVAIDYVEDADWEGKAYLRIVDKSGVEHRLGQHLKEKYEFVKSLPSGTPVKLTMATFTKQGEEKEYVKEIEKATAALADQINTKSVPSKNSKDISTEAQVAVKVVADMLNFGQVGVPEDIKELTFEWIRKALKEANK